MSINILKKLYNNGYNYGLHDDDDDLDNDDDNDEYLCDSLHAFIHAQESWLMMSIV